MQDIIDTYANGRQKTLAEWTGRHPQHVTKWLAGKPITDQDLRNIVDAVNRAGGKMLYFDLKYGKEWREAAATLVGKEYPIDDVELDEPLEIFQTLPPQHAEIWISIGHHMIQRYAPQGPRNPFKGVPLGGVKGGAKK